MVKKNVRLPDKPSELLALAMADLEALEKSGDYNINMDIWHSPGKGRLASDVHENGLCTVCMAGSVMAKTLQFDSTTYASLGSGRVHATNDCGEYNESLVDQDTAGKLAALNLLRMGFVGEAYTCLGRKRPSKVKSSFRVATGGDYVSVAGAGGNEAFKKSMYALIKTLKEAGE